MIRSGNGAAARRRGRAFSFRPIRRFAGISWTWRDGLPALHGSASFVACDLWQEVEGGDHALLFGLVRDCDTARGEVTCLALSRIDNFDDLGPLKMEPGLTVEMVLPGRKSTRGDLAFLRAQGWDVDLLAHRRRGGRVLGICGGYQMQGRSVAAPEGIEGEPGETPGLGLLDVTSVMTADKRLARVQVIHTATGLPVSVYEIHIGATDGPDRARPFAYVDDRPEGARLADGRVEGSYLHGLFAEDAFRAAWLAGIGATAGGVAYGAAVEAVLDRLAAHIETHLDVDGLLALAR